MRTWMVILLILSCVDFFITFKRSGETVFRFNLSWILRLLALILFCTNY